MDDIEPEYANARRVLLDALEALGNHRQNVILVGAQAVYFHTGEARLNVPLYTTDADLVIHTTDLAHEPDISELMRNAGFTVGANPGQWVGAGDIAVDLMVVPYQAGRAKKGARAARIPQHAKSTARITSGLEAALVDNQIATIQAFESEDTRTFPLLVAGPAALLVAKAIKLEERLMARDTHPERIQSKDALDAFRLLQAIDTEALVRGFVKHRTESNAATVSQKAIETYRNHAGQAEGVIAILAGQAAGNDSAIPIAFAALMTKLLHRLDQSA